MDKEYQKRAGDFFAEHHAIVIGKFRAEHPKHSRIIKKIKAAKEEIRRTVTEETWQSLCNLFDLLEFQNHIESRQSYIQGIKDCIELDTYLSTDFIDSDFDELEATDY